MDGRDVGGGVVLLGIAEVEVVVLPFVIFTAVILPLAVAVLFPDVAFCANVDKVVKFSAAITLTLLQQSSQICIGWLMVSILFIDLYFDIYIRNMLSVNTVSFVFL